MCKCIHIYTHMYKYIHIHIYNFLSVSLFTLLITVQFDSFWPCFFFSLLLLLLLRSSVPCFSGFPPFPEHSIWGSLVWFGSLRPSGAWSSAANSSFLSRSLSVSLYVCMHVCLCHTISLSLSLLVSSPSCLVQTPDSRSWGKNSTFMACWVVGRWPYSRQRRPQAAHFDCCWAGGGGGGGWCCFCSCCFTCWMISRIFLCAVCPRKQTEIQYRRPFIRLGWNTCIFFIVCTSHVHWRTQMKQTKFHFNYLYDQWM